MMLNYNLLPRMKSLKNQKVRKVIVLKFNSLILVENLLGTLLYLLGTIGSFLRYGQAERRGKLDAIFLISMTWGFCALMISTFNILKYNFIPTIHLEVIRAIYYLGAAITSLVFFAKNYEDAALKNRIAAVVLMGATAFVLAEGLVFYFGQTYPAALFSCSGALLVFFWYSIGGQRNLGGIILGLGMFFLPLCPILMEQGLDVEKLKEKREVAINHLVDTQLVKGV